MATIKKRAKDSGMKLCGYNDTLRNGFEAGYEIGATEQQTLDIEKACNVLSNILGKHLHGGEIDEVIAEFEEEMNK